jgi:hypothetical protein
VWTAENLINRTRPMAAKNGAALYHSHDLDAGKILFIQPIFKPAVLVSHQRRPMEGLQDHFLTILTLSS